MPKVSARGRTEAFDVDHSAAKSRSRSHELTWTPPLVSVGPMRGARLPRHALPKDSPVGELKRELLGRPELQAASYGRRAAKPRSVHGCLMLRVDVPSFAALKPLPHH